MRKRLRPRRAGSANPKRRGNLPALESAETTINPELLESGQTMLAGIASR